MIERVIAVCDDCSRILARDSDSLPKPTETTMYCLDCGQLSHRFTVKRVEGLGHSVGSIHEQE